MKLIVQELQTEIVQQFHPDHRHRLVRNIRPHILRFGHPSGGFYMQIRDGRGRKIAQSNTVNFSAIGSLSYAHGNVELDLTAFLRANTNYWLAMVATGGYSFSESAYAGWCNGFDLGRYPASYAPSKGWSAPLDYEVWGIEQVTREAV